MNDTTDDLVQRLYRTEYRKIVSVLCSRLGLHQIEVAEDLAGDTFLLAARTWKEKKVPAQPVPWLFHVAGNLLRNYQRRLGLYGLKVLPNLDQEVSMQAADEIDLSPAGINDSQLKMMFAVCDPLIPVASQIGLSLRILCGFSINEIAEAFLSNEETITKRLTRARARLREKGSRLEFSPVSELSGRISAVLTTIYLLFNEGYASTCSNMVLRKELCMEAIRLCSLLAESSITSSPQVLALLSLMYFHASRLDARAGEAGKIILYEDQNATGWDADLVSKGSFYLRCSAAGEEVSRYHLEAAIAWWHTQQTESKEKWAHICYLYQRLLTLEYSPVAAMNGIFALSKLKGKEAAITEAEKLKMEDNLQFHLLMGYLQSGIDQVEAVCHYRRAISLVPTDAGRLLLQSKLDQLKGE